MWADRTLFWPELTNQQLHGGTSLGRVNSDVVKGLIMQLNSEVGNPSPLRLQAVRYLLFEPILDFVHSSRLSWPFFVNAS